MKRIRFVVLAGVAGALLLPAPAFATGQILNDSERPGSVLIFHKFVRGTVDVGLTGLTAPRTELEISVTCPKGASCATQGQKVYMQAHWVCPGRFENGELEQAVCEETDFRLETTVNGTIYLNPEGGPLAITDPLDPLFVDYETVPEAPCDEGYLIVWVIDRENRPIKFDGLIGDAILRLDFDTAGGYNALPIQAATYLGHRAFTDVDGRGDLDFDGTEYQAITGKIFGTVRYDSLEDLNGLSIGVNTSLTLLTLDVKSNRPNNPTFVDLLFFNEAEEYISTYTKFVCWTQVDLTDINQNLTTNFGGKGARKGLVESIGAEKVDFGVGDDTTGPVTLVGIVRTEERGPSVELNPFGFFQEYVYSLFNDGEPVSTTFVPHALTPPNGEPPPNNNTPNNNTQTITFNDKQAGQTLDGECPAGVVDWGSGAWLVSGPWGAFTTNSISFNGSGSTSESFTFVSPKILVSLQAYNGGGGPSTVTISCGGNPTHTATVNAGALATISTGWTNACSVVTIGSSNGWETNFDNVTYK